MNHRNHYKSWSSLNQQLTGLLCDSLKGRITYFLTHYSDVHNIYGRAAIRLDGQELAQFTWAKDYEREIEEGEVYASSDMTDEELSAFLKPFFDKNCVLGKWDFLNAVSAFRDMSIQDALTSDDCIIRIFAILDRRCGKRTLQRLIDAHECDSWPDWARQFADIRFDAEGLSPERRAV
ncbi:MAG: hypothetical protein IJE08_04910 [Clostridia bacterium]|nr:hypothetical protein [Clostridia bacterium]